MLVSGRVRVWDFDAENPAGLHAMLIVGYNDRQEASLGRGSGRGMAYVKSSSFTFR